MKEYYQHVSSTIITALRKRQIEGFYCETRDEAVELARHIMPKQSTIGWGGCIMKKSTQRQRKKSGITKPIIFVVNAVLYHFSVLCDCWVTHAIVLANFYSNNK